MGILNSIFSSCNSRAIDTVNTQFDEVKYFSEGLAPVRKDDKWGYVNGNGEMVIPFLYDDADLFQDGFARVGLKSPGGSDQYAYINKIGQYVIGPLKAEVYYNGEGKFRVSQENKTSLLDQNGKILLQCPGLWDGNFNDDMGIVYLNNQFGYIDKTGSLAILPQFDYAAEFNASRAIIAINNLYGLINKDGNIVIQPVYHSMEQVTDNIFRVGNEQEKFGLIDKNGNMLMPVEAEWINNSVRDGLILFSKSKLYGILDEQAKVIVSPSCELITVLNRDFIIILNNGLYGVINSQSKPLIENDYSYLTYFEQRFIVEKDGQYGLFDLKGNIVCSLKWDYYRWDHANKIGVVQKNGKFGFADNNGNTVIPCIYEEVGDYFENDRTIVKINGAKGVIDKSGNYVIPPEWDDIEFSDGVFLVVRKRKTKLLDINGDKIADLKYDGVSRFVNGSATVKIGKEKWGCMDREGNELIKPHNMSLSQRIEFSCPKCSEGYIAIKRSGKWGFLKTSSPCP